MLKVPPAVAGCVTVICPLLDFPEIYTPVMAAAVALVGVSVTELLEVTPTIVTMSEVEAVVVSVPVKDLAGASAGANVGTTAAGLAVKAAAGVSLYCGICPPV
jgi:hypothetical protein